MSETVEMLAAIRDPMTRPRFIGNLNRAWDLTRYRIDRVPEYELARCGIGSGTPAPGLYRITRNRALNSHFVAHNPEP